MHRILKVAKIAALGLAVLFVVAVCGLLGLRVYRQSATARAIAIHSPHGIDEGMYVRIGGIDQWIQIRGQDRANPVLLCVHGGPGGTWIPLTELFVPWEKAFTLVQWDQRGAGKTLETTGPSVAGTMSVDRMARDGIEVSEFLKDHLRQEKLILLAHSWGSILGIHMAKQRPDLFHAYVGTGQVADMRRSVEAGYSRLLAKAREAHDRETVQALEGIGPPPFADMQEIVAYFTRLQRYEPESDRASLSSPAGGLTSPAPNYSLWDEFNRIRGFATVPSFRVYDEMLSTDLAALGLDFQVPIFLFQGSEDERTPAQLAKEYFEKISAPRKEMVLFDGGGHFAVWGMRDRFLRELVARVRPLAVPR